MTEPRDWLVWSHEHNAWWAADCCGYSDNLMNAGLYTRAEADEICRSANYDPTAPPREEARTLFQALREAHIPRFDVRGYTVWRYLLQSESQ